VIACLRIFARKIPTAATSNPPISNPDSRSCKKIQESTAIWIIIVLLMMLDSIAERCCKLTFQR